MMRTKLLIAKSAGFCSGVKRAIEQVEALSQSARGQRIVTLGPLIHNPQEIERLSRLGIRTVEENEILEDDLVVIRTHGVPADQLRRIQSRARVHDATCPHVRSCQTLASRMAKEGYAIVIVGDPGHPETESVRSFAQDQGLDSDLVFIASNPDDLEKLSLRKGQRIAILAQTTMTQDRLNSVASSCLQRFVEVRAFNTICRSSLLRQHEALALARQAEAVVVVGGKNSANTQRLVELCTLVQRRTFHIEVATELDARWFIGAKTIAITAGASTPESAIKDVVKRLEEMCE